MRSLQDIRIDVVRMGKEIRVDPAFEEKFKELNEFLKTKFGCPDFKLEDFELDKIDNTKLYISGGIGNSVLNLRLFDKPSFNLYRLVDK